MADDITDALERAHAQQRAAAAFASGINQQQAANVAGIAQVYPHIRPGVALSLGAAGVDPDSQLAQQAAKTAVEEHKSKGWFDRIGDVVSAGAAPIRANTRWALAGLTAPLETLTGFSRVTYGAVNTAVNNGLGSVDPYLKEHGTLGDIVGQTTLGSAVAEARSNDQNAYHDIVGSINPDDKGRSVLGDGFFPGVDSPAAKRQIQNARNAAPLVDGHAFTFGRYAAHLTPLEPGSKSYHIMSGLVDAVATLGLDPATYALPGVGAASRARNVISAGPVRDVELATRVQSAPGAPRDLGSILSGETLTDFVLAGDNAGGVLRNHLATMPGVEVVTKDGDGLRVVDDLDEVTFDRFDRYQVRDRASAGLVDGVRQTVLPERAHAWLAGPGGSRVADYLAAETDFERMRRATGRRLPVSLLVELKDATDPVTVKNLLADAVNAGVVREAPTASAGARAAVGVDDGVWSVLRGQMGRRQPPRWTQAVPAHGIDLNDADDAVEQLDRFQRNAKLPADVISRNNEALARAHTGGESLQVLETTLKAVSDALVSSGLKRTQADRLTTMFKDRDNALRAYYVDEVGKPVTARVTTGNIGGTNYDLISPHLASELLDGVIPLPDFRDIKRATSVLSPLFDTPFLGPVSKGAVGTADFLTGDVFKTFALVLRPAWALRVVGEEQARIAASGLVSAFNHPLSYLAWIAGDDAGNAASRGLIAALRRTNGQRGGTDVLGKRFTDLAAEDATSEVAKALNRGSSGWRDRHIVSTDHWVNYDKKSDHYVESWLDELTQLGADPVARQVAYKPLDEVQDWFWATAHRDRLVKAGFNGDPDKWDVTTRAGADRYVQSVLDRLTTKTSSHGDLIEAVATGRLKGQQLTDGVKPNKKARRLLEDLLEQGVGPQVVKGRVVASRGAERGIHKAADRYDQGAEYLFNALGAVPTNRLSRSPTFRQFYWQRIEEVAGLVDDSARSKLLDAAREANLPRRQIRQLEDMTRGASGKLTLEQADAAAKMHALSQTRDLLYDLHNRGQALDALRIVLPFGEAWREVLTRWARLSNPVRNPIVGYRLNQAIGEARKGGIFYPDPTTGEEMYAFPGGGLVTGMLTGVPTTVEAPAQGLNTVTGGGTGILPGVGPVVQWPVQAFLPDDPTFDDVRDLVMPFGETDQGGGFVESMLPAYIRKALVVAGAGSPAQKRALASTSRDVMAYLYSTGEYDTADPDDRSRLLRDSQRKAKVLFFLRALAQSTAPTAPSYDFSVKDKDGHLTAMHLVADDYRKLLDEDPETATENLLDKYGDAVFLATVGKTSGPVPTTEAASQLGRTHPELNDKFPNVWGLFTDPASPFDPSESSRQIGAGQRDTVTPAEALDLAHQRLGAAMYDQYRAMVPADPSDAQRMWLLGVRAEIKKRFPGYAATPKGLGDTERAVDEVIRASQDPVLAQTDAGQGLTLYLQYRDQAVQAAQAQGLASFGSANAALPLRMWLRNAADKISQQHPDFAQLWDRVLDRELKDDSEGVTP